MRDVGDRVFIAGDIAVALKLAVEDVDDPVNLLQRRFLGKRARLLLNRRRLGGRRG
jgi:hypothetical protein